MTLPEPIPLIQPTRQAGTRMRPPRPRRPGLVASMTLRLLGVLLGVFAALWIVTPSTDGFQARLTAQVHRQGGTLIAPGDVPPLFADAVVATEDERFYSHHGLDVLGLFRAVSYDVVNHCPCQGGSTITQQLIKNVYLNGSDAGVNKIVDMMMALKLERQTDKQTILADYLSDSAYGYDLYGAQSASCDLFGKPLDDLDLAQYALLAGLPQAPSYYDPYARPDVTRARRHEVLEAMLSEGYVTPAKLRAADAEALVPPPGQSRAC